MLCGMFALHHGDNNQARRPPAVWRTLSLLDSGLVNLAGRLKVTGGVPAGSRGRPLVLVANHIGVFDPFVLIAACRRIGLTPRFLLAGGLLDAPVIGPALRASGTRSAGPSTRSVPQ